jgi:hypothetical protein
MTRHKLWTMEEIFENSFPEPNSGCWIWMGSLMPFGYGRTSLVPGQDVVCNHAHRTSWQLANGMIAAGKEVHHKCRNPPCVNPDHLQAVTYHEHRKLDFPNGAINGNTNKKVCVRGHLLEGYNVIMEKQKNARAGFVRRCRLCQNAKQNRLKKARKARRKNDGK